MNATVFGCLLSIAQKITPKITPWGDGAVAPARLP
jgi:hypothetical protein